jgi:hypothetical protein
MKCLIHCLIFHFHHKHKLFFPQLMMKIDGGGWLVFSGNSAFFFFNQAPLKYFGVELSFSSKFRYKHLASFCRHLFKFYRELEAHMLNLNVSQYMCELYPQLIQSSSIPSAGLKSERSAIDNYVYCPCGVRTDV